MRQFFHGLTLSLQLLRALWADPAARRLYLRVGILQSVVIIALSVAMMPSRGKDEPGEERADRSWHITFGEQDDEAQDTEELDTEKQERKRLKGEIKLQAAEFERKIREVTGNEQASNEERARALAVAAKELTQAATAEAKAHRAQEEAREQEQEQEQGTIARLLSRIDREVQFWIALFGLMQVVQWVVIALSRDYHDAISREASLLTSLEPEDEALTPRIRLDMQWVRKKLRRRIQAFVVFMAGLPVIYGLTALFFPIRNMLLAVLIPAWSAYWLVVFTTARSAYGWKDIEAREPWFLRGWTWLTTRVPGLRWKFLQRYGAFWTNRTRELFPPAAETEKQPWAYAGLTVFGMLSMIPLAKCFLRPLLPVAVGHLAVAQQAERAMALKHLEPPAQQPPASSSAA